ncbi:hypothetical protein [Sulfobacillus harzensis]|uniref:Uncharacterized protein n=1 Tax=Sulfobacillus harzensis TaxID=2729629 RepID=A0A7Y0L946_9FIRM|nr:hypothetical protein [Sulfobacillus harzensis]NMP25106.1 hypothetical protein [Sulfobacillus harzensis]
MTLWRWGFALGGLWLAVSGGLVDWRGHLTVGSLAAVFGLGLWVIFSGSSALSGE